MENKGKNKTYISIAEFADMLGISRIAVFKKVKKGQIPAEKIGRAYAIPMEYVRDFVDRAKNGALTDTKKAEIKKAVQKVVEEYGETLRLLGKE
ncbi:MAG: helix-turn-helix domain-containing protein [Patescibacteria group bacterium]|nr:helix-turn-helix domain-containing protein [Patescibacteria group bacterium]